MDIYESAENYLEEILKLREDHGVVYSIDIVHVYLCLYPVSTTFADPANVWMGMRIYLD